MLKKSVSLLLSVIIAICGLQLFSVNSQAAINYSAFPVYSEMPEDNLATAPEIKLGGSYDVYFRSGTYANTDKTGLYSVYDWNKVLKFVPTETAYYEASIYVAERNQNIRVKFGYSDANSIKDNKYYSVSKGDYQYNIHTSKEESIADSKYNVYSNTARGAAYLEKGKTYYIIADVNYDDYNVEKLMKTEVQGYTYHTVPATIKVYKHSHDYEVTKYKYPDHTWAYYDCKVCDYTKSTSFYKPKSIILSTTSYTYNGKEKKPSVTVKDTNGNKISSSYYTVTYASGRKYVGKYKVTVKFKGEYAGYSSLSTTFTIKPPTTTIKSLTAGSKKFTVKWNKQSAQTTGYQIQYATNSNFKSAKTVTVSGYKNVSKTISKLSGKKKYYVRVRTYKTINGTKYYSSWSKSKAITTKK